MNKQDEGPYSKRMKRDDDRASEEYNSYSSYSRLSYNRQDDRHNRRSHEFVVDDFMQLTNSRPSGIRIPDRRDIDSITSRRRRLEVSS